MQVTNLDDTRDGETAISSASFDMLIVDVFTISGKGVVVTGQVESGAASVGDTVCVSGGAPMTVDGIEMRRETPDTLQEGDLGGLLFADLLKDDVEKGSFVKSCN
jgi:translation elongation factor EF-Tu-like GTPase